MIGAKGTVQVRRNSWSLVLLGLALAAISGCGDSPTDPPPVAATVVVSPSSAMLDAFGDTTRFTAKVLDQYGQEMVEAAVIFESGDEAVAAVNGSGLVTAVGNGSATVTAASGVVVGSAVVTVEQEVAEVRVSPDSVTLVAIGDTVRLAAEALDSNGHGVAAADFEWSSDDSVATVDATGLVMAAGNGSVIVTAASGTAAGSAAVIVEQAVAEVRVSPDSVVLHAFGDTVRLAAEALDANGHGVMGAEFEWSSADSVATVDDSGLVTAVANGVATVTATSGSAADSTAVNVEQRVAEVRVSPDSVTLHAIGDTVRLAAEALDSNGNQVPEARIEWSSTDASVASVDTAGVVTAVGVGATEVRAISSGSASGAAIVQVPAAAGDREALLALFAVTGGPNWSSSHNWATDAPLGDWYGITTDEAGRVVELDLQGNNLAGPIPPEVGDLTGLKDLYLSRNALVGAIPPTVSNLVNLRRLFLSHNRLTGRIPAEIGALTDLWHLWLETNRFTGSVPPELGNLVNLRSLHVFSNELSGAAPTSLLRLERLESFLFEDNDGLCVPGTAAFEDWLPETEATSLGPFCNAADVEVLASFFKAAGGPEWHRSTRWLQGYALGEWHGVGADSLGRVETLDLRANGVTGKVPSELGELSRLTSLRIGENALSGHLPLSLSRLSLRELHYAGTKLCAPEGVGFRAWLNAIPSHRGTGVTCRALSDREILTAFYEAAGGPQWERNDNWLTDAPLNRYWGVVADSLDRVEAIWLGDNGLTGHIAPELGGLERLKVLHLGPRGYTYRYGCSRSGRPLQSVVGEGHTTLWPALPARVGNRDTRHDVSVWSSGDSTGTIVKTESTFEPLPSPDGHSQTRRVNQLTGRIPAELGSLANLERLHLVGNDLSGSIPPEFDDLVNLRFLDLALNALSGPIPPELGRLVNLERLVLPVNALSGRIPPELGNLASLEYLSVERNELSGPIPPELGDLASLESLAVGGNDLSGLLPRELGNLVNLQEASLSVNRFEGPIPPELGNLANLLSLSLFCTSVTGSVPPTLGQLPELYNLDLFGNRLTGEIPPQLGRLPRVQHLRLSHNYDLAGVIPPALGQLAQLLSLDISSTGVSGPIPEELGRLANLESLSLSFSELEGELPRALGNLWSIDALLVGGNRRLIGPIPRELMQTPLRTLTWHRTGLCAPRDRGFQDWLAGLELNLGEGSCTFVPRKVFQAFYDATGGSAWERGTNWLTEMPVSSWFGVTVEDSLVTALELPGNGLAGALPPEIGDFGDLRRLDLAGNALAGGLPADLGNLAELESLDLSSNRFSGSVPHELARLRGLTRLHIGGNELRGALPGGLAQLGMLEDFVWENSGACAPEVAWFQTWLESVGRSTGPTCDGPFTLSVAAAHLTQAAQDLAGAVPLIAGRPALLRVFATADRANDYRPGARVTFHSGGRLVRAVDMQLASTRGVPDQLDPGQPEQAYQALVPGSAIRPGVEMVVDVDPDSIVPRAGFSEVRVPLDVREMPPLKLTIVPVVTESGAGGDVLNWVRTTDDPAIEFMRAVLPVADLDLTVREPFSISSLPKATSFDDWLTLLQDINLLRTTEGGSGYWYAVVEREGDRGIAGIAYIGRRASVGIPDAEVFAHELGHNMSLRHAPCGRPAQLDPGYPYRGGTIGVYGFDPRADTLVDPSTPDLMSYCHPQWISDYNFRKALEYRLEAEAAAPAGAAWDRPRNGRVLLWGGVDTEGRLRLDPAFALEAPAKLPTGSGPYRIEGFAPDGASAFAFDFAMDQASEGGGGFHYLIPFEEERLVSLERIVLSGPEGSVELGRETLASPIAIVVDQDSGRIRSILRGEAAENAAGMAADQTPGGSPVRERVLVSYGLPDPPTR